VSGTASAKRELNPLHTVAGRLALGLFVVVGGALVIVYLTVVPAYSQSLLSSRLSELRSTLVLAASRSQPLPDDQFGTDDWAADIAQRYSHLDGALRVVVFTPPPLLEPFADSDGGMSQDIASDPLVARAATSTRVISGEVDRQGSPYAEAAASLGPGRGVLLLTTPLTDELDSVAVVRHRVILAGILATLFAIVVGYAIAVFFSRRIRRLEVAAGRIAAGRFDDAIVDSGRDELGQLARAFEQMRVRLASLDRARSEFIANASHELRTPLFALGGFLELLIDDDELDAATRREFLAAMQDQIARLSSLAMVLLDLSRLDAGELSVHSEAIDLAATARTLARDIDLRAELSGHRVDIVVDGSAIAHGDSARVLQIGRILLDNALVHTPAGCAVTIEVGADEGEATLSVSDDGPGIPIAFQGQVFERFYRLGGAVASGSGLGLAIARELAVVMGGRIELLSEPGRTRFRLVLPAEPGIQSAAHPRPSPQLDPADAARII
jgi:signal transduction histidine kinase